MLGLAHKKLRLPLSNKNFSVSGNKSARRSVTAGAMRYYSPSGLKEEEEIGGSPFTWDSRGSSNAGAGAIADSAVAFNLTDAGTAAVADGAVAVDLADAGAAAVADGAVSVDLTDAGTRTVADGAVAIEPTHAGAAGVANSTVIFNFSAARTAAIVYGLGACG